jgi:hypothetical protein
MRARGIKPGLYTNEELAECSFQARFLFPGLWMLADREGRLEDRPKRIKGELFPYDDIDVDALLCELASHGFIVRYEVDATRSIQIATFSRHQRPHSNEAKRVIPPCPGVLPAMEESTSDQGGKDLQSKSEALRPSSLIPSSLTTSSLISGEEDREVEAADGERDQKSTGAPPDPAFGRFWAVYPRATGKSKAYGQWRRTLEDGAEPDDLIRAAEAYAAECRREKRATGYVKHPATFLGPGRHWADYLRETDANGWPYSFAYEDLASLWDRHMPKAGFMPAPEPTRMWRGRLADRIGENPSQRDRLDWWLDRLREIDDSDFASGRRPTRDGTFWRLELHRLLESEETLQKLVNGVYRNRESPYEGPQFVAADDADAPDAAASGNDSREGGERDDQGR